MEKEILTFNDLPQVVAQLRDEVMGMRALLTRQQAESSKPVKENRHKPMTVDEAIEYTHIPKGTMYMKLEDGTIPAASQAEDGSFIRTSLTSGWRPRAGMSCL